MSLSDLKIGVIGCGAMGRLITNTLIVLSKCNHESNAEGLKTSNVAVSTRQTEHLSDYQQKYGVQVYYNNEQLME
jgi:pyrroline-5-carboxylate reductase